MEEGARTNKATKTYARLLVGGVAGWEQEQQTWWGS